MKGEWADFLKNKKYTLHRQYIGHNLWTKTNQSLKSFKQFHYWLNLFNFFKHLQNLYKVLSNLLWLHKCELQYKGSYIMRWHKPTKPQKATHLWAIFRLHHEVTAQEIYKALTFNNKVNSIWRLTCHWLDIDNWYCKHIANISPCWMSVFRCCWVFF